MTESGAKQLAADIIAVWDSFPERDESVADKALHSAIDAALTGVAATEFAPWFAPVAEWNASAATDPVDSPDDYTMDECCEVLRAFVEGRDCDILAILNACPWAMKRESIK